MDLKKIFLTPPNTRWEKITLLVMMVVLFVMFFGPICFTDIHPVKAIFPSPGSAAELRLAEQGAQQDNPAPGDGQGGQAGQNNKE